MTTETIYGSPDRVHHDTGYSGRLDWLAEKLWQLRLTHRYVNGELRLLVGAGDVTEIRVPPLSTSIFQDAQMVNEWGDVTRGKPHTAFTNYKVYGIYRDAADSRLHWIYGDECNSNDPDNPSLGCSILNDSGSIAPYGALASRKPSQGRSRVPQIKEVP
jgi:hypothetical protein